MYAAAALVVAVAAGLIGFAAGNAGSENAPSTAAAGGQAEGLIRQVDGIPVGIQPTRAGAAAAAGNYVAVATETIIQDPARYEQLVRTAYAPGYQEQALREGQAFRREFPTAITAYAEGTVLTVAVVARRIDAFANEEASVTTWSTGVSWGGEEPSAHAWALDEVDLQWDGQRWLVSRLDAANRPAPAPEDLSFTDRESLENDTFERELREMQAPQYGG